MAEQAQTDDTPAVSAGVQRARSGLAESTAGFRRALRRLRGRARSSAGEGQGPGEPPPGEPPPGDDSTASPPDLADADASVQRAWKHLRLVIVIVVTVAPVVAALISWRFRVWRARRSGQPVDP
jgi:hypothetical protein